VEAKHAGIPLPVTPPPSDLPDSREQETNPRTGRVAMRDLDDFLTPTLARQLEAEKALINGDP